MSATTDSLPFMVVTLTAERIVRAEGALERREISSLQFEQISRAQWLAAIILGRRS